MPPDSGHQPSPAEAAWEAHYKRIYPASVFSPEYMAGDSRPAFIAAKRAGFICGWEEATEASSHLIEELELALELAAGRASTITGFGKGQTYSVPAAKDVFKNG